MSLPRNVPGFFLLDAGLRISYTALSMSSLYFETCKQEYPLEVDYCLVLSKV